jgi:hypothetical protein
MVTRLYMFRMVANAYRIGGRIMVRSSDTDVLIILVSPNSVCHWSVIDMIES